MTNTYEEDLVRLLLKHGRITHIVKADGEERLSALALVQRCMSANIAQVVPLTETSAAVSAPGGLPASLRIFGVQAEKVDPAAYGFVSTTDRSEVTAALDELEDLLSNEQEAIPTPANTAKTPEPARTQDATADGGLGQTLSDLAASVSELSRQLDTPRDEISADLAGLAAMVEGLSGRLDALAQQRDTQEDTRLDAALARLEHLAAGADVSTASNGATASSVTETVFGRLAAALEAVAPRDSGETAGTLDMILREIGELSSLQHLALKQLATLIDAGASMPESDIGELLADLRLMLADSKEPRAESNPELPGDVAAPAMGEPDRIHGGPDRGAEATVPADADSEPALGEQERDADAA